MNILAIETSCDETSASIVKDGKYILSNVIASSIKEHEKYGGIVPEIASRHHLECINDIVKKSIFEAKINIKNIDAIAVTASPGLIGSLLVGTSFAKALSYALKKPLILVDHIKAHLYASFLKTDKNNTEFPQLPAVGLVVSGGHTSLYHIKNFDNFKLLGETLDDAAGEAFDKTAKILDLGYPGGPIIDRLARKSKPTKLKFKCGELPGSLNFSFSGIKTAVLYFNKNYNNRLKYSKNEISFAFQNSVISVLIHKCIEACKKTKINTLVIGGGVAANSELRKNLIKETNEHNIKTFIPDISLCMDNAAMVAGIAYHYIKKKEKH